MRLTRGRRSVLPLLEHLGWITDAWRDLLGLHIFGSYFFTPHVSCAPVRTHKIVATLFSLLRTCHRTECPEKKARSISAICECLFQHARWLSHHKKLRDVWAGRVVHFMDAQWSNYAARLWMALCALGAERTTALLLERARQRQHQQYLTPARKRRVVLGALLCCVTGFLTCIAPSWFILVFWCVAELPTIVRATSGLLRWRAHRQADALLQRYHCVPRAPSWRRYCVTCIWGTGEELRPIDLYQLGGLGPFASSIVKGRLPGFFRPLRLVARQVGKQLDLFEHTQSQHDVVAASLSLKLVHIVCARHRLPAALVTYSLLPFFRRSSSVCGILYGLECDAWDK
jgi:hypothetical protein